MHSSLTGSAGSQPVTKTWRSKSIPAGCWKESLSYKFKPRTADKQKWQIDIRNIYIYMNIYRYVTFLSRVLILAENNRSNTGCEDKEKCKLLQLDQRRSRLEAHWICSPFRPCRFYWQIGVVIVRVQAPDRPDSWELSLHRVCMAIRKPSCRLAWRLTWRQLRRQIWSGAKRGPTALFFFCPSFFSFQDSTESTESTVYEPIPQFGPALLLAL